LCAQLRALAKSDFGQYNMEFALITGKTPAGERKDILRSFALGLIHVVICTASGSTGINPSPGKVITDGPITSHMLQIQQNYRIRLVAQVSYDIIHDP
jgi:hypothetical protein